VSDTTVRSAAGSSRRTEAGTRRWLPALTPAGVVILAGTLFALGLRAYQLAQPGHLLGVGDYDDGADFGSALRLIHGALPYRDFIIVQPPGITLLMTPAAALSRLAGTAWAIGIGRMLTIAAGAAAVAFGGLLVRHRGVFATVVTCGIIAIYPGGVQAAHTVLLEPWLTVFCLAGAVTVFDGDRLAGGRRLVWGGVLLGFAGAIKVWAIIPVAVIAVLCLPRVREAVRFLAGVAVGFGVAVLPFAAASFGRFYSSVVVAQLVRTGTRTPMAFRLQYLTGLTSWNLGGAAFTAVAVVIVAAVAGTLVAAGRLPGRGLTTLEWFGVVTAVLIIVAFLVPAEFYYHYPAFLAPFLALAFVLPAARILDARRARRQAPARVPRWWRSAAGLAGLVLIAAPLAVPGAENSPTPTYADALPAVERVIPPGACVLSDQASLLISANRFVSATPGCPVMVDGTGTSYALGRGQSPLTSGRVPAVAALWRQAFGAARYVLLTSYNPYRIAWTPALRAYFRDHFVLVGGDWSPLTLYVRKGAQRH
jgi:hypothetical protein